MNPYESLSEHFFWKTAVAQKSLFDIDKLWEPKFNLSQSDKVVTFGSCFAQHIGRALSARGFNWYTVDSEAYTPPDADAKKSAQRVFSARTGNIYTTSLLKQWVAWALGKERVPEEYWHKDHNLIDPFRPAIEQDGFHSVDDLRTSQLETVSAFRECILQAKYFVFTLGLTESWFNITGKYEHPTCPGTIAGKFDDTIHKFINQGFEEVKGNLLESIMMMRDVNPDLRFILTVSPVPLTATKSGKHVLVATMASKSVLRAVAGQLTEDMDYVDYFPSYEIINSPVFKGIFFEPNQRNVNPMGVEFVMGQFFSALERTHRTKYGIEATDTGEAFDPDCEEALLEAFGRPAGNIESTDRSVVFLGNSHLSGFRRCIEEDGLHADAGVFIPQNWLIKTIKEIALENKLTEFRFNKEYNEMIGDIKIETPKTLVIVGLGLAGDGIVRAHGELKAGFAGCKGEEISPSIPIETNLHDSLINFYRDKVRGSIGIAKLIEDNTNYERIIWIASPDMTLRSARFRLGSAFVDSGSYNIHKRAYLKAFNEESRPLERTRFVFHPNDKCCPSTGFSLDIYRATDNDWDIHCSKNYFADSVSEISQLI